MATTHYLSCAHCTSPLLSYPLPLIYICNPTSVSLVGFECFCSLEQKMERRGGSIRLCILALYVSFLVISSSHHCDAKRAMRTLRGSKHSSLIKKLNVKRLDGDVSMLDSRKTNTQPYGVSSPFSLPPFDSLGPIPLPDTAPPFCPPPSPVGVIPGSPEYTPNPIPPEAFPGPNPNPPVIFPAPNPNPPETVPSRILIHLRFPPNYRPSPGGPGGFVPSPPHYVPTPRGPGGPGGFVPTPPFQPPVVFPPPTVPPPPHKGPNFPLWCVAKPTVPDPIIEEAMNYACGSGADCASIGSSGSCFQPDTLFAHASYAFNSYWQRTKVAGGTCDFGGTAMLVSVDPSRL
ncbi:PLASMODESMATA CALLOSE-BINDING PROTEIN 3 [Vitis vinifera]|uniref:PLASMODESMATA CALLOSE-BINDING PROTEIN 3 n=1 Tax=Vitis vinifera TaxID=29760 RepID=A0A438IAW6_VITVI|nr:PLASMODESMATA CALLOSE-BINDING PROTEIN 3 [Vitis vinifera]